MYAETGLLFPYYQNFSLQVPPLDEFWDCQKTSDSMNFSLQVPPLDEFWDSQKTSDSMASTILEYDLGAEGDLFKAPESIIEEPNVGLDPITAAISMISGGEDVISTQALKVADIELMQNEQLLSEIFCEFKKDLLANEATGTQLSEVMQIQIPIATDEIPIAEERVLPQGNLLKSVSSECLSSMEWIHGNPMRPNFLDFPGMDFGAVYGMRRSFSEGDIKAIVIHSPRGQAQSLGNCTSEDRREKLSRYRNKKTKRNFGRKIKYACRKALADSQPRIRGRFAKTDESDISKSNNCLVQPQPAEVMKEIRVGASLAQALIKIN